MQNLQEVFLKMIKDLTVEYSTGKVKCTKANMVLAELTDMIELEYWEDRLNAMKVSFVVAYKKKDSKVHYFMFAEVHKPGSPFKA